MSFKVTHTRNDGKVDVNLIFKDDSVAIYHRRWPETETTSVIAQWGACCPKRFDRDFIPCVT